MRKGVMKMDNAILKYYCDNDMQNLKRVCYPILIKIGGISEKDYDDFYSIALDALADSYMRYDDAKNCQFSTFLTGNINRKFKTEIRDRNRAKRIPAQNIASINCLITDDGMELSELLASDFDLFDECFGDDFKETRIERYLNKLSNRQRKIVSMLSLGYKAKEIRELLHMSTRDYLNNLAAIQAYENVRILMSRE